MSNTPTALEPVGYHGTLALYRRGSTDVIVPNSENYRSRRINNVVNRTEQARYQEVIAEIIEGRISYTKEITSDTVYPVYRLDVTEMVNPEYYGYIRVAVDLDAVTSTQVFAIDFLDTYSVGAVLYGVGAHMDLGHADGNQLMATFKAVLTPEVGYLYCQHVDLYAYRLKAGSPIRVIDRNSLYSDVIKDADGTTPALRALKQLPDGLAVPYSVNGRIYLEKA